MHRRRAPPRGVARHPSANAGAGRAVRVSRHLAQARGLDPGALPGSNEALSRVRVRPDRRADPRRPRRALLLRRRLGRSRRRDDARPSPRGRGGRVHRRPRRERPHRPLFWKGCYGVRSGKASAHAVATRRGRPVKSGRGSPSSSPWTRHDRAGLAVVRHTRWNTRQLPIREGSPRRKHLASCAERIGNFYRPARFPTSSSGCATV